MVKSSLCDYCDVYILVIRGTITVVGVGATAAARQTGRNDKQVILQNCTLFTDCISEINKTQLDNAKDLDVAKLIYNLIEYSDIYSNTSIILYQFCRDSESFKPKWRLLDNTNRAGILSAEIAVTLKYLRNFWKNHEML